MARYSERAARLMEHLVTCPGHGYSQYSRNGDGTIEIVDGVQIAGGDRDCSSAVISCYSALGLDVGGATYTGNMRRCMTGTGNFVWKDMSYSAQRGDIYLNEVHHAAMCIHPYGSPEGDILAQFSISESGTVDGQEGDQTGYESNMKPYYNYPWDGKLVCVAGEAPTPSAPAAGLDLGDPNWWGARFSRALQEQRGTQADGVISGQTSYNKQFFWAVEGTVSYTGEGSSVVLSLQKMLQAAGFDPNGIDGHYGPGCIRAHQRWLNAKLGAGLAVDGYHGTATNCAMARALQAGLYR